MATRHQARRAVVGLLYAYDLGNESIAKYMDDILEEEKIRNKQREFSHALFQGVLASLEAIDDEIGKHLLQWDYGSIGRVEKAILRLATYEMLYGGCERPVVINEAIELAKELADEKAPKFVNGVLDAIGKAEKETT